MKKLVVFAITLFLFLTKSEGQIYMADSCRINFFSAATIEDITADNTSAKPVMSSATGDIQISLTNEDFVFKKKLMQEHFNEDYMESDKFPHTIFKGKVNEKVDYNKDGVNNVTVTGTMDMHGVKKVITIPGTLTIQGGVIFIKTKFDVKVADYKIKVPSLLGNDIAESVAITVNATMKPYKIK